MAVNQAGSFRKVDLTCLIAGHYFIDTTFGRDIIEKCAL